MLTLLLLAQDPPRTGEKPGEARGQEDQKTQEEQKALEYVGKPLKVSFSCSEDDIAAYGMTCTVEEPCPVFLELAGIEAVGNKIFLSGNLHASELTMASILLSSFDSGKTWREPFERLRSTTLEQIQFFDFETGWISGQQLIALPKDPFFLITNDGGQSWRRRPVFGEAKVGSIEQFSFDSRSSGALVINRTQTGEGGTRHELYETMTGGETWMVREVSGKPLKLKRPRTANADWRVRADSGSKSFRIERRQGEKWATVAAFLIQVGECKPAELTLSPPPSPEEKATEEKKDKDEDPGVFRVGGPAKKGASAKKKKP